MGCTKKQAPATAQNAWTQGLQQSQLNGDLKDWASSIAAPGRFHVRLFDQRMFCFIKKGAVLKKVFPVPPNLLKQLEAAEAKASK